jgi:ABC-type phosphate transport system permease subunit
MIYERAMGPYPAENRQAWAGILVLLFLIFVLNVVVRLTTRAVTRGKTAQ